MMTLTTRAMLALIALSAGIPATAQSVWNPPISAASGASTYLGVVSTNNKEPRNLMTAGAGRWQRTACQSIARDDIVNPTQLLPNYRIVGNAETNVGAGTVRAWIEYPTGTYTQTNENIAAGGMMAFPNGISKFTYSGLKIPKGATFRTWVIQQNDNGTPFFQPQHNDNAMPGDVWETGTTAMPTAPGSGSANTITYCPLATLALTTNPSFILLGDSREEGSDAIDDQFENGQTRPSLGRYYGYINLSISAQTLANYQAATKTYRSTLFQYVTDAINNYGINDIGTGGTVATLVTNHQNFITSTAALAGPQGLRFWTSTLPPYVGTTDGYLTLANEAVTGTNNVKVNDWNYRVRTGQIDSRLSGFFDIAAALDPGRTGRWPVSWNLFSASYGNNATFTASVDSAGVMTVTAVSSGTLAAGDPLCTAQNGSQPNAPRPGTRIRPFGTDATTGTGGTGTYKLTRTPTGQTAISSTTFYICGLVTNDGLHMSDVGRDIIKQSKAVDPALLLRSPVKINFLLDLPPNPGNDNEALEAAA